MVSRFKDFESQAQAALMGSIGGMRGWLENGIINMDYALIRQPFERARNPRAFANRGRAWTIRDGVETPLVLGITYEIPVAEYRPTPPVLITTLDDPLA